MDINPKTVPEQAGAGATVIENLIICDLQHNWESQLNSYLDIPGLEVWQQASQMKCTSNLIHDIQYYLRNEC